MIGQLGNFAIIEFVNVIITGGLLILAKSFWSFYFGNILIWRYLKAENLRYYTDKINSKKWANKGSFMVHFCIFPIKENKLLNFNSIRNIQQWQVHHKRLTSFCANRSAEPSWKKQTIV